MPEVHNHLETAHGFLQLHVQFMCFLFVVWLRSDPGRIIDVDYPVPASCEQSQFWGDRIATYKPAVMHVQGLLLNVLSYSILRYARGISTLGIVGVPLP